MGNPPKPWENYGKSSIDGCFGGKVIYYSGLTHGKLRFYHEK
jgi:hypothetical protein